jgi:hypothetical protein
MRRVSCGSGSFLKGLWYQLFLLQSNGYINKYWAFLHLALSLPRTSKKLGKSLLIFCSQLLLAIKTIDLIVSQFAAA